MSVLIAQQDEAIDHIQLTGVDVEKNTKAGYVTCTGSDCATY